ncbi:MAG: ATP-binding protein [Myxococcales bacterium]|nr:ATP-binding protein [Myxococcales bacterium]
MLGDDRDGAGASFEAALESFRLRGMIAIRGGVETDDPLAVELALIDEARAAYPSTRMAALAARIGLEPDDVEFLWFAVAWARDPLLAPHLHVLVAEPQRGVTLVAFARVVGWAPARIRRLAGRLGAGHPLLRHQLVVVTSAAPIGPLTPLLVPERVSAFLAGGDGVDAALAAIGGRVEVPSMLILGDGVDLNAERIALALGERRPVVVVVTGPAGVGRRTVVAEAARRIGRDVVAADLGRVASGADIDEVLHALRREVALTGAVPMVVGGETVAGDGPEATARRGALTAFAAQVGVSVAIATTAGSVELDGADALVRYEVAPPEAEARLALWRRALAADDAGVEVSEPVLAEIALRFRLVPGAIERAWRAAQVVMHGRGAQAPIAADLTEGVRRSTQERLGGLARAVHVKNDWQDLVLPEETREEIGVVVARARHAYQVLAEWGFARHVSGDGIAVLFSGPPGTGKTMVAGLVARELGLDLYRVDLSQVVSKWIGETEKSLGRVFDAAETGHVLLLFDEADALFARRTEVKGATERYANLEVNYLLQRIESFAGIAILTTNLDGSIDDAFRRRLAAHVQFPAPGDEERERLWRALLPAAAPVGADLDASTLAARFPDFCGGHIRNATLAAAFLAATEGVAIGQRHLEHAARDVARSMGRVLAGSRT